MAIWTHTTPKALKSRTFRKAASIYTKDKIQHKISMNSSTQKKKVRIGNVGIDFMPLPLLMKSLDNMADDGDSHYVCFCDLKLWSSAMTDESTCRVLNEASIVLPDGIFVTRWARFKGQRDCRRLPGPFVMLEYCRHSVKKGRKHFLYGGPKGVADLLAEDLKQRFPGIQIAGHYCPPFRPLTPEEEIEVKNRIEASKADVLWVGLGAPKQERWMAAHIDRINVPLMLGVGAAFDFHSGKRKRAPEFVQKIGLEWLFCTCTGGRKIFLRNMKYVFLMGYILLKQISLHKQAIKNPR
jgi:N-acetylglucosaminyldiphosphoundecaprenol N-acetyl-beta-D-mannosaminyltransferase